MNTTGPKNLITDVAGLRVGNASDHKLNSGVTAIVCDPPATAAVQVLGGAPGTRETDLLEPHNTVETVNGIILSGGSAFGLDAASGAQACLREQGKGFEVGPHRQGLGNISALPRTRLPGHRSGFRSFRDRLGGRRHRCADGNLQGRPRICFHSRG
jgi:L-aminopeptidase/D-esterase-like protein